MRIVSLLTRTVLALSFVLSGITLVAPPAAAEGPCPDLSCVPCPGFDCLVCPGGGCTPPPCDLARDLASPMDPCYCVESGCSIEICGRLDCYVSDPCSTASCCVMGICWYSVCNTMECPTPCDLGCISTLCDALSPDCPPGPIVVPNCPGECWPPVPVPPCPRICAIVPDEVCIGRVTCIPTPP